MLTPPSPPLPSALLITILCIILTNCLPELLAGHASVVVPCVLLGLMCTVCVVIIWRQPESKEALTFKVAPQTRHTQPRPPGPEVAQWAEPDAGFTSGPQVPLLPWLPLFSVFVNIYLMMQLDMQTWINFTVWMVIGTFERPLQFGKTLRLSSKPFVASFEVHVGGGGNEWVILGAACDQKSWVVLFHPL